MRSLIKYTIAIMLPIAIWSVYQDPSPDKVMPKREELTWIPIDSNPYQDSIDKAMTKRLKWQPMFDSGKYDGNYNWDHSSYIDKLFVDDTPSAPIPTADYVRHDNLEIDTRLLQHFNNFLREANARGVVPQRRVRNASFIIMKFDPNLSETHGANGFCDKAYGQVLIRIDTDWWNKNPDPMKREGIVFHELAHAFLNRKHRDDMITKTMAASVMNTYYSDVKNHYESNRTYYLNELFNNQ